MKLKPLMAALALGLSGLVSQAAVLGQMSSDTSFSSRAEGGFATMSSAASPLAERETPAESGDAAASLGTGSAFADPVKEMEGKMVAEPESYAIVLAGLGVVGFLARRRRND